MEAGVARTSAFAACFLRRPMLGTASVRLYLLGVSMGLVLYTVDSRFLPEMTFHQAPDTMDENLDAIREALSLDEILAPQATLGVFAAGALSYYTGRRSIDFLGKTDPHIARLPPDTSGKVHVHECNPGRRTENHGTGRSWCVLQEPCLPLGSRRPHEVLEHHHVRRKGWRHG